VSTWRLLLGDCRESMQTMPAESVQCCVTSPPYWGLRDYGHDGQLGLEPTPDAYVASMVAVFREVRRVLRPDGTLWLNLGDSYAGSGKGAWDRTDVQKEVYVPRPGGAEASIPKVPDGLKAKDLVGIPWRVAFALQADGWYLRSDIIWAKPNPMPESVTSRPTKSHEYVFLLSRSERYYYDAAAIAEPVTESTIARLSQDVEHQMGSDRVPGKTNGRMKAVGQAKYLDADGNALEPGLRTKEGLGGARFQETLARSVAKGTRNARTVWTIPTIGYSAAHFATFPPELAERCIKAGSKPGDTVLDPFAGSGTTGMVATGHGRDAILCELNPEYAHLIRERCGPILEAAA
jgi:DNA modification methylase